MTAAPSFPRNSWYVAGWEHEVTRDALFERTILGQSILFYRTADGSVVAMDNRCCHRHAPLSLGRREGDDIRCMYHGLKYDRTGRCVEIPGQTAIPARLRLRTFPIVEQTRWIWIWMGDPERADASLIPETAALQHPEWRMKPGYMRYAANHLLISDNLLDFSHLSYVHEATLGGSAMIAETRPAIEKLERGLRVTRRIANATIAPYQRRFAKFSGPISRFFIYDYLVPGVLLMKSGVHASDPAREATEPALNFRSCQAITPESERSTHYFFMQAHGFALDDETVTESLYQSLVTAFNEDRRIIEAQQNLIDSSPPAEMVALPFDSALAHYRRIVARMVAAEPSTGNREPAPAP